MKKPLPYPTDDLQDFHEAYSQMKKNQYQEFFKYISFVICSPFIVEGFRAFIDFKFSILVALIIGSLLTVFVMRCIYQLKLHKEMGFTIFCFVFMSFMMVVNYSDPVGYFLDARNSFYFGYGICSFERQVKSKIPDMKQRIMFRILIFFSSLLIITPNQISLYIMQSVHAISGIYFDLDDETKDKKLFKSYFSYKNQLVQFKDLVVKNIPESIFVISQDMRQCLFANNLFLQDFSADKNNLNVKDLLNKFQVQDNPSNTTFFAFISSAITNNWNQEKVSCSLTYSSSENKIFEAKAIQIAWDDQPAIAIILHDITEQHTILSLKVADAQKDALLATVSHELRTPLNGMLGMLQILQKRVTDKQLLHYVNICKNSGNLLAALVNSILDLNQIRASTIRLYPEKVNVKEFLDDLVNLFEVQCTQKNITLHLDISSNLSREIYTDRNRLSQILINLLGNALKFTTQGKISIQARHPKNHLDHVEFSIVDTGIGIKEKDKKKLFRIFGKLEQSDTRVNKEGVGLGLTIADNLARLLCENDDLSGIKLQSEHGKGSSFSFYIKKQLQETQIVQSRPLITLPQLEDSMIFGSRGDVENKMKAHRFPDCKKFQDIRKIDFSNSGPCLSKYPTGLALSPEKPLKKKEYSLIIYSSPSKQQENIPYVLIIDDNPLNLIVAEYLVASHGCKVKTALSGKAAIDLALKNNHEKEPIRLILMDLQMPDMDGYQTTKNLRKLMKEKEIPEIPIVALTANDSQADRDACFKIGMENYLSKPLREAELIAILNTYVYDSQ